MLKLSIRRCCQPGSRLAAHSGSVGRLSRTSIDDGVRWNTYSCSAAAPRCGHALHRGRAGADDADPLVGSPVRFPSESPPV